MSKTRLNHLFKVFRNNQTTNHLNFNRKLIPFSHNPCVFKQQNRLYQTSSEKCWKCGVQRKNLTDLFCQSCKIIQPPYETKNYFKLFGLEFNFDINQKDLTQHYRKLQTVLHPDKFSNSSPEEKKISEEYSSLVNKAFGTLQLPLSRALHMLKLNDETIDESNKSDDPEFLGEVMELNEELEEADTEEKLREIERKNKEMIGKVSTVISRYFKDGNVTEAKRAIIRMKYYDSLSKRIHDLLREKGIVD